jgi:predicted dehydrogenase
LKQEDDMHDPTRRGSTTVPGDTAGPGHVNGPSRQERTRRGFLSDALAAAGAAGLAVTAPRLLRAENLNSRVQLACIGVGGRGYGNLREMTKEGNAVPVDVVALCDVDQRGLERAVGHCPQARTYRDFRRLYEAAPDVDGVVVSTCEHTHAFATLPALRMGKAVYCEKPLTLNVEEARLVREAAAAAKVPTQMGTQIHASENYRRVVELVRGCAIGPVTEVHVWVNRAWGLQSQAEAEANNDPHGWYVGKDGARAFVTGRPAEAQTPPAHLDWDLWLGPAPARPYHEVYFPGPKWYRWWDFGNGTMSDLGSHWNDLPFWALDLDAPVSIEAIGPDPHPEIAPASMTAVYAYPARGDRPACRLTWYQGTHRPPLLAEGRIPAFGSGVLFVGTEGRMLLSDYGKHVLLPEERFKDFAPPEPWIPPSPGQHQEWLLAIRDGTPTSSPFDPYAGLLTEANHLGNVAFRAGEKILWDSAAMRVTNTRAADRFLARVPREGWSLHG